MRLFTQIISINDKLTGLKAYRIKNFNGSSKRFQFIRVPNPVPRPPESLSQSQKGGRRTNRTTSVNSTPPFAFPTASPTPRFRAPYPHQRNITAFEYPKAGATLTPGFSMDRTPQVQPQQFQYPVQYSQTPQYPQQQQIRPMPPQQQQPPTPQPQQSQQSN